MAPVRQDRRGTRLFRCRDGAFRETLCHGPLFRAERIRLDGTAETTVTSAACQTALFLSGTARLDSGYGSVTVGKGGCVFFPAGLGPVKIRGRCELILTAV